MNNFDKRNRELKEIKGGLIKLLDGLNEDEINSISQEDADAFMVLDLILAGDLETLSSLPTNQFASFERILRTMDNPQRKNIDDDRPAGKELLSALIDLNKAKS